MGNRGKKISLPKGIITHRIMKKCILQNNNILQDGGKVKQKNCVEMYAMREKGECNENHK